MRNLKEAGTIMNFWSIDTSNLKETGTSNGNLLSFEFLKKTGSRERWIFQQSELKGLPCNIQYNLHC